MSMTRDAYAKEVIKVAEAAFRRNEVVLCPHETCGEQLNVARQSTYSSRSLFCPVHGVIFKEQEPAPFGKLDWDAHERPVDAIESEIEIEEEEKVIN